MKYYITLSICFLFVKANAYSQSIYWQDLSSEERVKVIMDSATYSDALNFYFGKIEIGDNSQILILLKEISETQVFNPLYFYLFNKVLLNTASNDVKDVLPKYCYSIFTMFPNEVLGSPANVYLNHAISAGFWLSLNHDETDRQAKLETVRNQVKTFENLKKDNGEIANKFLNYFESAARNKVVE